MIFFQVQVDGERLGRPSGSGRKEEVVGWYNSSAIPWGQKELEGEGWLEQGARMGSHSGEQETSHSFSTWSLSPIFSTLWESLTWDHTVFDLRKFSRKDRLGWIHQPVGWAYHLYSSKVCLPRAFLIFSAYCDHITKAHQQNICLSNLSSSALSPHVNIHKPAVYSLVFGGIWQCPWPYFHSFLLWRTPPSPVLLEESPGHFVSVFLLQDRKF